MNVLVGTSGFSYKEWKGTFYPEKISPGDMLAYYSTKLPSVEINNTFYRLPKKDILESWMSQTPDTFRFVLKASRRITHFKRLLNAGDVMDYMYGNVDVLQSKLGAILFQLPPNYAKNVDRLKDAVSHIPADFRAAFEFRHESWFDEDVFEVLEASNCALCIADTDGDMQVPFRSTADWGYLRLRRPDYSEQDLQKWAEQVNSTGWKEAFVFFKHEEDGAGPALADRFRSTAHAVIN